MNNDKNQYTAYLSIISLSSVRIYKICLTVNQISLLTVVYINFLYHFFYYYVPQIERTTQYLPKACIILFDITEFGIFYNKKCRVRLPVVQCPVPLLSLRAGKKKKL